MLAGSRFARACTCVAAAAVIGGCSTAQNTSSTISGKKLTIYASVPSTSPDVLDAEKLALQQTGTKIGGYQIAFKSLSADSVKQVADNARTADSDTTTVAYLGEVVPGLSEQSVPITNELGILEVSPTDNALELTSPSPVVSGSQNTFYPSRSTYGYTFGRIAPSSRVEASDMISEIRKLGVSKLYVADDGSDYGRAIANVVGAPVAGTAPAITPGAPNAAKAVAAGADGVFYGGSSVSAAASFFNSVAATAPSAKLFAPSALDNNTFAAALSSAAARNMYVSGPGFLAADLPAAGTAFERSFTAAYGHAPASDAIFGFAAMKAILDALHNAGAASDNRTTVANDFFALNVTNSVVGPFKINKDGDSNLAAIVFSRVRGGKLVPFAS
jgi:branched-chain amino acid transport system substrate-binding protein